MPKYLCAIPSFSMEIEAKNKKEARELFDFEYDQFKETEDDPQRMGGNVIITPLSTKTEKLNLWIVFYYTPDDQRDFIFCVAKDKEEAKQILKQDAKQSGYSVKDKDIIECFCVNEADDKKLKTYNVIIQPQ